MIRVVIDKPMPGGAYKVGGSYLLPAHTANAWIAQKLCHVATAEDFARQQKREKEASKARQVAKAERKAELKAHTEEVAAARPLVDAKDALDLIDRRLAAAERRLEEATGKKRKEWDKTVKVIRAEQKDAREAVAKLEPDPEPGDNKPGGDGEGTKPKIEMG